MSAGNDSQLTAIERMLKAAEKENLLVEVVWSFSLEVRAGESVATAAATALREWDI